MNKYKKALIALARISFTTDETEYGDSVVRQVLYRQLRALGIIKFKNGDFIFEEKRKEHPDKDKGFLYIQSGKAASEDVVYGQKNGATFRFAEVRLAELKGEKNDLS